MQNAFAQKRDAYINQCTYRYNVSEYTQPKEIG